MKPPTAAQIRAMNKENAAAAARLTTEGMSVQVTDDFGAKHDSTLSSLPWQLGHGTWVCNAGRFRAYDCSRIRPIVS